MRVLAEKREVVVLLASRLTRSGRVEGSGIGEGKEQMVVSHGRPAIQEPGASRLFSSTTKTISGSL
jgi:hypothetical protein